MSLGKNIAYLRKQKKFTQEQLAEQLNVSRQTVSKWEADEIVPELGKLSTLCDIFSCKLDTLVREDISAEESIYSEITIRHALTLSKSDLARLENIVIQMAALPLGTRIFGWSGAVQRLTDRAAEIAVDQEQADVIETECTYVGE